MRFDCARIISLAFCCLAAASSYVGYASAAAESEAVLSFSSPQEAAEFLLNALQTEDLEQLQALVGKGHNDLLFSGDDNIDAENREAFVAAANRHMRIEKAPKGNRAVLLIGEKEWPFPLPLLKQNQAWVFDAAQGKEELLNRRIGRNELNVLRAVRGYVEAQYEYAGQDRDGDGIAEYAQKLYSDTGMQNGLYWPAQPGTSPSPLGPLLAQAQPEAAIKGSKEIAPPFHGYYYKILYRQGEKAVGGKYMYVLNGNMIAGFSLLAFPARYGETGIYSFTVNHRGEIYQRDLGTATAKIAAGMKDYNPDENWQPVKVP